MSIFNIIVNLSVPLRVPYRALDMTLLRNQEAGVAALGRGSGWSKLVHVAFASFTKQHRCHDISPDHVITLEVLNKLVYLFNYLHLLFPHIRVFVFEVGPLSINS